MNKNKLETKTARKQYSPQFKEQALERALKGGIP
jgi:transposase-like protein